MMTALATAIAWIAAFAAVSQPALAAAESEPNDDVAHPSGLLQEGVAHQGSFQSGTDHDWFVLYTHPSRHLDLAITKIAAPSSCSSSIDARLLDADGRKVDSKTVNSGETDNIRQLTAPGPARYYLVLVTNCPEGTSGDPYEIIPVANGAVAATSPAAAGQPVPDPTPLSEPDDNLVEARGPLAAGVQYGGTIDEASDEDWFVLYPAPWRNVDIAITKVGAGCSSTTDARLFDQNGRGLQGTGVASNETDHFRLAAAAMPTRFYVQVFDNCAGDAYQLWAGPSGSLDLSSPLLATQPAPTRLLIREPNDRFARAFGPLLGSRAYAGSFRSQADVDHAVMYSSAAGIVDLAVTKVGRGCSNSIEARLFDPSGHLLKSGGPATNQVSHLVFRARRPTAYVLRLYTGCKGDPYQVRADSAAGLRRTAPPLLSVARRADGKLQGTGHLLGRIGLRRAYVCPAGRALISMKAAGRRLRPARARVRRDCSYAATLKPPRRVRRMTVAVRFTGHRVLKRLRGRRVVSVR